MKRFAVVLLILTASAFAQISRPVLGLMVDANGGLRSVYGVPASTTLGDPLVSGVLSPGCSAILCLAKTDGALWSSTMLADGSSDPASVLVTSAPAGPALFAFSAAGAYVYFSKAQALVWWQAGMLTPVAFAADGEILALNAAGDGLDYAVRRSGVTWVEHVTVNQNAASPAVIKTSFGETGPVILMDSGTLVAPLATPGTVEALARPGTANVGSARNKTVLFVRADGTQMEFALPGVATFSRMSGNYVQAVGTGTVWAIVTASGSERTFVLPGIPVHATAPVRTSPAEAGTRLVIHPASRRCCEGLQ